MKHFTAPLVSVVIPICNEEAHLRQSLEAVLRQDYPADSMEIIVADGGSTDGSRDIVREFAERDKRVRLVENPRRHASAGLNAAIAAAHGQYLVRVDGHTVIVPDYVARCVAHLQANPDVGSAGGSICPVGETLAGQAIALALRSPFSMGGAAFRHTQRPGAVDTVYLGAFRRQDLLEVGLYNASLGANEDYELHFRLLRAGRRVWFDPQIRSRTYTRRTLFQLARQYARYGYWKGHVMVLHPGSVHRRHTAALLGIAGFLLTALAAVVGQPAGLLVLLAVYGLLNLGFSVQLGWLWKGRPALLLPLVFVIMHLCWGTGLLIGLAKALVRRPAHEI
ncbi:MAG: glycosyltransferase family 2 protein [Anaerolineae bacterium]